MGSDEYERVRRIALSLPDVNERMSHGAPCFFVRNRRPLCYFHDDHTDEGRISIWCPVPAGVQEHFVATAPDRFFKPVPSARGTFSDWLGVYVDLVDERGDSRVDWDEVADIVETAFRMVAPKSLVATLDAR